jgi:hypothetical protein
MPASPPNPAAEPAPRAPYDARGEPSPASRVPPRGPATSFARTLHAVARIAALVTLVAGHAFGQAGAGGWLLPGVDDVVEPRPALVTALHRAADAARAQAGLAATTWDEGLARAARQHAAELAERGLLDHASPTPGRHTVGDRLARAGSPYASHAENLAYVPGVFDTVRAAIDGWLDSPPHRANLLGGGFDRVGFGTAVDERGGVVVVQVLAAAPWLPQGYAAEIAQIGVSRVSLGIRSNAAITAYIEVGGRGQVVDLRRGAQSWQTEVSGGGPWPVRIGVRDGAGSYFLEEAGEVAASGRWRPSPAPRRQLRVSGAEAARQSFTIVRLSVDAPAAPPGTALLVDGVHRPEASVRPGRFEFDLELADGATIRLTLAEPHGDGRLLVRHGVTLERAGAELRWAARP